MKKILAIVTTLSMMLTVPAFADTTTSVQTTEAAQTTVTQSTPEAATTVQATQTDVATVTTTTATQEAGITPDSIMYSLDKLMEKIQLSLITDAVDQAELLAKLAQERLAESSAMADKADVTLTQKALEEYKTNLQKAIEMIETAMTEGKQVAEVMESINVTNVKDAATVEKILSAIPDEFKVEVKTEIDKLAAAAAATTEVAQVVEQQEEEQNSVKLEMTLKLIEEKVEDPALIAKIKDAGLNTRQIIAVISLAEQTEKPLGEVIDLFVANEMGIGATAHELGLTTKDALKGINSSFKDTKDTIKKAFKEAIKTVEEEDKAEVETIVNNSLAGVAVTEKTAATVEEVKAVGAKLEKVVKEAKEQVEVITAATKGKKAEKAIEKAEKEIEKAEDKVEKTLEKAEKAIEKDAIKEEASKNAKDDIEEQDNDNNDGERENNKESKGKADKN